MEEIKGLYIIVEGKTDIEILKVLLCFDDFKDVYMIPSLGYHKMPSLVRTLRLMKDRQETRDKFLVVFDSDSTDTTITEEKVATMRYLINADYDNYIGVFAFRPNIEEYLFGISKKQIKCQIKNLSEYLESHLSELREKEILKDMQRFIDSV